MGVRREKPISAVQVQCIHDRYITLITSLNYYSIDTILVNLASLSVFIVIGENINAVRITLCTDHK